MNTGMSWTGCKKPLIDVVDVCKRFRLQREKQRSIQDAFIHFWRRSQSAPEYFWPLRNLSLRVCAGDSIGVLGQNGSGKSTLLQIMAGYIGLTKGQINWFNSAGEAIDSSKIYQHISIAAPYLELVEELTALEQIAFHQQFKPLQTGLSPIELLEKIGLINAANKQIRNFSSGMKQRLKLFILIL